VRRTAGAAETRHAASAKAHIGDEVLADELGAGVVVPAGAGVVVPAEPPAVSARVAPGHTSPSPSPTADSHSDPVHVQHPTALHAVSSSCSVTSGGPKSVVIDLSHATLPEITPVYPGHPTPLLSLILIAVLPCEAKQTKPAPSDRPRAPRDAVNLARLHRAVGSDGVAANPGITVV